MGRSQKLSPNEKALVLMEVAAEQWRASLEEWMQEDSDVAVLKTAMAAQQCRPRWSPMGHSVAHGGTVIRHAAGSQGGSPAH